MMRPNASPLRHALVLIKEGGLQARRHVADWMGHRSCMGFKLIFPHSKVGCVVAYLVKAHAVRCGAVRCGAMNVNGMLYARAHTDMCRSNVMIRGLLVCASDKNNTVLYALQEGEGGLSWRLARCHKKKTLTTRTAVWVNVRQECLRLQYLRIADPSTSTWDEHASYRNVVETGG